jgi:thiamine pyrophosphokinase
MAEELGQHQTVVVFIGGDAPVAWAASFVPASAVVVAADSGVDHALALGVTPSVVVGDLDSVSAAGLASAEESGARIERHDRAKDHTDFELALQVAVAAEPACVVVIGGSGGRLDHVLGNAMVLASPTLADVQVMAYFGTAVVHVVRPGRMGVVGGVPGQLVTLLPVGGTATRLRTTGLRFALDGEDLHPWSARGVSNEFVDVSATVELATGVVLVVVPDAVSRKPEETT